MLAKTLVVLGGEVVMAEKDTVDNFGRRIFPWQVEPSSAFDTRHELGSRRARARARDKCKQAELTQALLTRVQLIYSPTK